MSALLNMPAWMKEHGPGGYFGIVSDFCEDQSDTFFIDTATDSGSAAVGDAVGGVITLLPSDGSVVDNDEVYLESANEIFKVANGKPMYAACRLQFTEANTDDANVAFGFQNAVGADSIIDSGAGLKVSGDTIAIYKVDGGTTWKCVSVINGATAKVATSTTTAGGSAYQLLEIEVLDGPVSTECLINYYVDGVPLRDSDGNIIQHRWAYASATEVAVFAGMKNGDNTNVETLLIDYMGAWQKR